MERFRDRMVSNILQTQPGTSPGSSQGTRGRRSRGLLDSNPIEKNTVTREERISLAIKGLIKVFLAYCKKIYG